MGQQSDDLQEFINNVPITRGQGESSTIVVDLSAFTATLRETTLEINTGKSYLFINGTLERATTLNDPIMLIDGGSSVEIGKDAIITGINHIADERPCEIVQLNDGSLNISQGIVEGAIGNRYYENSSPLINPDLPKEQDAAVCMTSSNSNFYLGEGEIYGSFNCKVAGAKIHFDQGKIRGIGLRNAQAQVSSGIQRRATTSGIRYPYIITSSNIVINATTSENYTWGMPPSITLGDDPSYSEPISPFVISLYDQSVLKLQKQYWPGFEFDLYDKNEGDVVAEGLDYTISAEDAAKMKIESVYYKSGSYYYKDERQAFLKLKDNKVYLTYKNAIDNVDDLQAKIDEIAAKGTSSLENPEVIEIAEEGILIDKLLQVRNNCHVVLTGGTLRISPTIGDHSCVYIWSNSSLTLNNITVDMMNNDFSVNSYIFNIMGTMKVGEAGGEVTFINVPYNKGSYGECLFYVYKYANLYWNAGTRGGEVGGGNISIIKALSTGTVEINGGKVGSFSVPTIDGDGEVSLGAGVITGVGGDKGIVVANSFHVTNAGGQLRDTMGEAIYIRANMVYFKNECSFIGKYNKIIVNKTAGLLGSLNVPTLYIGKSDAFDSFLLYSKLTTPNGWKVDADDWTRMELDKSFIKGDGYQLTLEDFQKIEFLNLPIDLEAYYDESDQSVKLRKKVVGDDLQEYVNNQTGDRILVNLSQFSQTTRSKSLEIRTGREYLFYGGTLKKAADCIEPLIVIGDGSSVEIGTIDGDLNERAWIDAKGVVNGVETVRMEGGVLNVTGGILDGGSMQGYGGSDEYDTAVLMTSDEDVFVLNSPENDHGGWVSGPIVCEAAHASITLKGGHMHTNSSDFGTIITNSDITTDGSTWLHVELLGKDNVVNLTSSLKWVLQITAMKKGYNDVILKGADFDLSTDNNIKNFKYVEFNGNKDYKLRLSDNQVILGIDDLQDFINDPGNGNGEGTEEDPIKAEIDCEGIDVNSDLTFKDDLQYFISGYQAEDIDCQGTIRQNEGNVTIPAGTTVTYTHLYLYGCGCNKYVYVYGTLIIDYNIYIYNYLHYIYLRPGGRVIIRGLNGEVKEEVFYIEGGTVEYRGGESYGGIYGWYNVGGTFYIYDGTIRGGTCGGWTGANGVSYIYGGTVEGGIYNYGTTYLYGGTVHGGSGYSIYNYQGGRLYIYGGICSETIWSQGNIYIDGGSNVNIKDIYVVSGCRIYIFNKLTFILRLNITLENIVIGEPIVIGDGNYKLTEEDCENIEITLPDGYGWRYDPTSGSILIYKEEQDITVVNSDDLQNFINNLGENKGTEEQPVEIPVGNVGLTLDGDVDIDDDLQLFINGGVDLNKKLPVKMRGGILGIYRNGCTFRFYNVDFSSIGSSDGGIKNFGKFILANCKLNDGSYFIENLSRAILVLKENTVIETIRAMILNSGDVYLDGTVSIGNLRLLIGSHIYVTSKLTKSIHFSITSVSDIEIGIPIIVGSDGYQLTQEDCEMIDIQLPDGYGWYYDETTASIVVTMTDGIVGISNHKSMVKDSYNLYGRRTLQNNKGVTIVRMNNGDVRKMIR